MAKDMAGWMKDMKIEIAEVIWKETEFVIFRDKNGDTWRYMPGFHTGWPFIIGGLNAVQDNPTDRVEK